MVPVAWYALAVNLDLMLCRCMRLRSRWVYRPCSWLPGELYLLSLCSGGVNAGWWRLAKLRAVRWRQLLPRLTPSCISSLGLLGYSLRAYLTRLTVLCMLGGLCPCSPHVVRLTQLCLFMDLVGHCGSSNAAAVCTYQQAGCVQSSCVCIFYCCSRSPGRMRSGKLAAAVPFLCVRVYMCTSRGCCCCRSHQYVCVLVYASIATAVCVSVFELPG